MEDVHGKEIPLGHVTVKVPGMRPRGSRSTSTNADPTNNGNLAMEMNNLSIGGKIWSRMAACFLSLQKQQHYTQQYPQYFINEFKPFCGL